MDKSPRRIVTKWLTIALFALLIASFALWGIGDIFRSTGGSAPVIKVGEIAVSQQEFARSFRRQFNQLRRRFGGNLDMSTAREMGLVDRITQQIATRALIDAHARNMDLIVSDEQLVGLITEQQAFQDSQGQFVRARFETALRRARISEQEYTELLRTDIHRQQLQSTVTEGAKAPEAISETLFKYRNETRTADYAVLKDDSFKAGDPTESELRSFYESHDQPFMAPAYREVTLIHLTTEELLAEVKVTEEALREVYRSRKSEFQTPERRDVRQIVFNERETAEKAASRLSNGASLTDVARALTDSGPIDLGTNSREDLLPALADPVFNASPNSVVGPIETALGWHVLAVENVERGETKSFASVRDQLRKDLARDKAVDVLVSRANQLDDELASGASLEQAAQALGLRTRHIDAVDEQGRNRAGEPIENLPQKQKFLETVFNLQQGKQSLLKETDAGDYFVLRVDSLTPPQKRSFEAVGEKVEQLWLEEQRREKARDAAERLQKVLDQGTPFEQAANIVGVEVQTTPELRRDRNQNVGAVPRILAGPLFNTDEGKTLTVETDTGVAVAKLTEVQTPDPDRNSEAYTQLEQQVQQSLQNDMFQQFVNALRQRYALRINESQLETVTNRIY